MLLDSNVDQSTATADATVEGERYGAETYLPRTEEYLDYWKKIVPPPLSTGTTVFMHTSLLCPLGESVLEGKKKNVLR